MCTGTMDEPSSSTLLPSIPWPESRAPETLRWRQIWSIWTYSYMNRILDKGHLQTKQDGVTHLTQADLFRVPMDMESKYLSSQFQ
jgi:hypothetical protein